MLDVQNVADRNAVALRTEDPSVFCGYLPRYIASDVGPLLREISSPDFRITVSAMNSDAPLQFKVLCKIEGSWPSNYRPCSEENFEPILSSDKTDYDRLVPLGID